MGYRVPKKTNADDPITHPTTAITTANARIAPTDLLATAADAAPRVVRRIGCPECGCKIGITGEDEGKTVVCPGCSCFLGTPMVKPEAARRR